MKKIITLFLISLSFVGISQTKEYMDELKIIDTTFYNGDSIVIFNNKDWEYLKDIRIKTEPSVGLKDGAIYLNNERIKGANWTNNRTFSLNLNLRSLSDSITVNINGFNKPVNLTCNSKLKIRNGKWHKGNDFAGPKGTKIVCSWDGVVRYAKMNGGGYGNLVIIRHNNGLETYYAHLSSIEVKPNQKVNGGDLIGLMGSTGHSTGSHLHYEIRFLENVIDPGLIMKLIKEEQSLIICKDIFITNKSTNKKTKVSDHIKIEASKTVVTTNRKSRRRTSSNMN